MSYLHYDIRVQANFVYNPALAAMPARDPYLASFDALMWHGIDDEGPCVFRMNSRTRQVVRIDFQAPWR